MVSAPSEPGLLEYATAAVTSPGERECGDRHVVAGTPQGTLVAVIDALGHGGEAAHAAKVASKTLQKHAGEPLAELVQRCHQALRVTRGAVMSVAFFKARQPTLAWLSVGNVQGVLLREDPQASREDIILRGGVVGSHLPTLQPLDVPVSWGDVLIFATDGIRPGFDVDLSVSGPLQPIADGICARYSNGSDDALVLVARYLGGAV